MNELIRIIKILGVGCNEIVIDIDLSEFTINSIEIEENNIILHIFSGIIDFQINYDDLSPDDKVKIITSLKSLIYN